MLSGFRYSAMLQFHSPLDFILVASMCKTAKHYGKWCSSEKVNSEICELTTFRSIRNDSASHYGVSVRAISTIYGKKNYCFVCVYECKIWLHYTICELPLDKIDLFKWKKISNNLTHSNGIFMLDYSHLLMGYKTAIFTCGKYY